MIAVLRSPFLACVFQKTTLEYGLGMPDMVVAGIRFPLFLILPDGNPCHEEVSPARHCVSVSIFALSLLAPSEACAQRPPSKPPDESRDLHGHQDDRREQGRKKVEYKAIATSQYKDEEKRIKEDYEQKMKEWHDLKKTDPTAPRPRRSSSRRSRPAMRPRRSRRNTPTNWRDEEAGKDKWEVR